MVTMQINGRQMHIALNGTDEEVLCEVRDGVLRILDALAEHDGAPVSENMATLMLSLIQAQEQSGKV